MGIKLKILIMVFVLVCCSCSGTKKIRYKIERESRIDTIIKVYRDTIKIVKYAELHDTIMIDNDIAVVRSFYDTITKKSVLEFKGKPIEVKIEMRIKEVEKGKKIEKKRFPWFLAGLMVWISMFGLYRVIKNEK